MPGDTFRRATARLFAAGVVDSLLWTYELGFGAPIEPHVDMLLETYAHAGALSFHGVSASPLGPPSADLPVMLTELTKLAYRAPPNVVSEHFGFSRATGFARSAPLPVPRSRATARVATERLARLSDACAAPAGLENLAFAFSLRDVLDEGGFLDAILEPIDGFVVLDLHNLYCRASNFGIDPVSLMKRYPLHRVREIHVSGGSESDVSSALGGGTVRRDTHDDAVPTKVFELLASAPRACPNVTDVFLERVPESFRSGTDAASFAADFDRVRAIVGAGA